MLVGTTIQHNSGSLYSPSFPRGGEAATFAVEATVVNGSPTLVILVEHKNEDDTTWATAATFGSITGTGVSTLDGTGLKEELRFKYAFSGGSSGNFVHLVVSPPAWRPY